MVFGIFTIDIKHQNRYLSNVILFFHFKDYFLAFVHLVLYDVDFVMAAVMRRNVMVRLRQSIISLSLSNMISGWTRPLVGNSPEISSHSVHECVWRAPGVLRAYTRLPSMMAWPGRVTSRV